MKNPSQSKKFSPQLSTDDKSSREVAFQEQATQFQIMLENSPTLMLVVDPTGICTYLNQRWYRFTGQAGASGLGLGWFHAVYPDDREGVTRAIRNAALHMGEESFECRLRRVDDIYRWVTTSLTPLRNEHREFCGLIGSIIDITHLKSAQLALKRPTDDSEWQENERTTALKRSHQHLQKLVRVLIRTGEQDRRRVATGLHDYLAQMLVVTRLKLVQIKRGVIDNSSRTLIDDAERILDEMLTYTHSLVTDLSPQVVYQLGLCTALRSLGAEMKKNGLTVHTEAIPTELIQLDDDVAINLFRSVRELLDNVVNHSNSTEATVSVMITPNYDLTITVSDQGQGFDVSRMGQADDTNSRFGLLRVTERMESIGGLLLIRSQPDAGTSVTLKYPLIQHSPSQPFMSQPSLS